MTRLILPHAPTSPTLGTAVLAVGEIAVDETLDSLRLGDGSTPGGKVLVTTQDLSILLSLGATVNNTTAIQAALSASDSVYLAGDVDFGLSSKIVLNAGKRLFGPGMLKPLAGFADRMVVDVEGSDARLEIDSIDGTNMPTPSGAWTGGGTGLTRAPVGCAVFVNGSSGAELDNVLIKAREYSNFPSGPVCGFYADRCVVDVQLFTNVQTYTSAETNGVVSMNSCVGAKYLPGHISGYNWKGWYFGNCTDSFGIGNTCENGATGHASHYDQGGSGCGFYSGAHDGSSGGDGYKGVNAAFPFVRGFVSKNSTGAGVLFQGCTDWEVDGVDVLDSANKPIYITAVGPVDCRRGTIDNYHLRRTTQGTTTNHVGIYFEPVSGGIVDTVEVGAGTIDNMLYGIWSVSGSGLELSNVNISTQCKISNSAQYDVLLYSKSATVSCEVKRAASSGSGECILLSTNASVPGTRLLVDGVRVEGFGTVDALVKIDGAWDMATVTNLQTTAGGRPLRVAAGSTIKNLTVNGVDGWDAAQVDAVDLHFTTSMNTLVHIDNVKLPVSGGGYKSLTFTISGGATLTGFVSNAMPGLAVNGGSGRPRTVYPFQGTGSPEGVVTAPIGSLYFSTDASGGFGLWVKDSGSGNTGWDGK